MYAGGFWYKEGTEEFHTYLSESDLSGLPFDDATVATARRDLERRPPDQIDPRLEALVTDLIGAVADKWTMLILEVLEEHGEQRFTQIGRRVTGISQKMLTQTLRRMERDGLVIRTVHAVVPPRVDYRLSELGLGLSAAFCGVWIWAEANLTKVESARSAFQRRSSA